MPLLVVAAGLALAIAVIHLQDQGGLLGNQSVALLRYGYYLVEVSSTIAAGLIIRGKLFGWLLGLASSIGPMTGYVLSRTVGIPGDAGDVGNWGYLLGTVSLVVEGSFVVIAGICLMRLGRQASSTGTLPRAAHAMDGGKLTTPISPTSPVRRPLTSPSPPR
jgi:hypothetical protein